MNNNLLFKNMAGIYIFSDDNVLMLYRTKKKTEKQWYSIGGKLEPEELNNPYKGVLRELLEETGIGENDIEDIELKYIAIRMNKNNSISQNYLFFAKLKNKNIKLKDCDEGYLEWISLDKIFSLELPASSYNCLKHYFNVGCNKKTVFVASATNVSEKGQYIFTELLDFDTYSL